MPQTESADAEVRAGNSVPGEFTPATVRDETEITTNPAEAIVDEYDDWEDFASGAGDFEEIDGVGPKSAGALDALQAEVAQALDEEETTDTPAPGNNSEEDAAVDDEDSTHERVEALKAPLEFDISVQAGILQAFVHAITVLRDEFRLIVTEDGLTVAAVDAANVQMVDATLEKEAIDSWDASPGVIGVDGERLWSVLKMASSSDTLHLTFDAETKKMIVQIDGLTYTLGTFQPESITEPPEIPEGLELSTTAVLPPNELKGALNAVDMVSDHVELASDSENNGLFINGEGDTDKVEYSVEELASITPADDAALYSTEYMERIPKSLRKFKGDQKPDNITVRFGDNMPVKTSFSFADGAGDVLIMLAPRIQSQ